MKLLSIRFRPDDWRTIQTAARREGISAAQFVREASVARVWYVRGCRDSAAADPYALDTRELSRRYGMVLAARRQVQAREQISEPSSSYTHSGGTMEVQTVRFSQETFADISHEASLEGLSESQFIRQAALARVGYLHGLTNPPPAEVVAIVESADEDIADRYAHHLERLEARGF